MAPLLYRALRAQPGELAAVAWAFAYFFLLLCSYYLLRPVRDALAVEAGAQTLQWLFTATFVAMLALVPVFGWLCAQLPRARLLPLVYGFFVLNLLLFSAYMSPTVFFVWLSVFNLFAVSVFWSFMSDIFDTPQAARLYGAIAAGGSCGAIAGPLIAAFFSGILGHSGLLLVSAALLSLIIPCIAMLGRWSRAHPRSGEAPPEAPLGGSILAGVRAVLGSRFLLAICGYLLCYTALSTALYFQQVAIVKESVPDMAERTRLFASIDLVVNSLTLVLQILAFSRLTAILSPGWLLAVVPLISLAGFLWLGAAPTLAALVTFGVARRVGEFAVSKPAREALFTIVPREERYKAKNFIDTVVYRGGDAGAGWLFGALGSAIAIVAAALSVAWTAIAFYLGARMKSWTRDDARSSPSLQPGR
jgi:AAA family ATP:ADP antiporter